MKMLIRCVCYTAVAPILAPFLLMAAIFVTFSWAFDEDNRSWLDLWHERGYF